MTLYPRSKAFFISSYAASISIPNLEDKSNLELAFGVATQIKRLISDKKVMIKEKVPGTQPRTYGNSPLLEAWGITIENEKDFNESQRLKSTH